MRAKTHFKVGKISTKVASKEMQNLLARLQGNILLSRNQPWNLQSLLSWKLLCSQCIKFAYHATPWQPINPNWGPSLLPGGNLMEGMLWWSDLYHHPCTSQQTKTLAHEAKPALESKSEQFSQLPWRYEPESHSGRQLSIAAFSKNCGHRFPKLLHWKFSSTSGIHTLLCWTALFQSIQKKF